jgi:hypothetical protein
MTNSDEGWEDCADEGSPTTTTFYRYVAALGRFIRESPDPVEAYRGFVQQYRPSGVRARDWLVFYDDLLIDRWVFYSSEIQRALRRPVPVSLRSECMYRDCIEDLLCRGEWPPGSVKPVK